MIYIFTDEEDLQPTLRQLADIIVIAKDGMCVIVKNAFFHHGVGQPFIKEFFVGYLEADLRLGVLPEHLCESNDDFELRNQLIKEGYKSVKRKSEQPQTRNGRVYPPDLLDAAIQGNMLSNYTKMEMMGLNWEPDRFPYSHGDVFSYIHPETMQRHWYLCEGGDLSREIRFSREASELINVMIKQHGLSAYETILVILDEYQLEYYMNSETKRQEMRFRRDNRE